jgi:hypothetical protein
MILLWVRTVTISSGSSSQLAPTSRAVACGARGQVAEELHVMAAPVILAAQCLSRHSWVVGADDLEGYRKPLSVSLRPACRSHNKARPLERIERSFSRIFHSPEGPVRTNRTIGMSQVQFEELRRRVEELVTWDKGVGRPRGLTLAQG